MINIRYPFKFAWYKLTARHKKGHGIHSPFLFGFIENVLNHKNNPDQIRSLRELTKQLKKSKEKIKHEKIGAGSKSMHNNEVDISKIFKLSSIPHKYGNLLMRLVQYYKSKTIIELGTSIGISSLYLALGSKDSTVYTIEGSEAKHKIAIKNAQKLKFDNIKFHCGTFFEKLPQIMSNEETFDLVFIDGDHQKENTIQYFHMCLEKINNDSIIIIDDIHWSKDMEHAWKSIINNQRVSLSLDLFRMGIIFFKKELSKEHYVIKF